MDSLTLRNFLKSEVWHRFSRNGSLHMYGCLPFDVCAGVSHWRAVHLSVVDTEIYDSQKL